MAIYRLVLVILGSLSIYAEATEPAATTCLSTIEGVFREFKMMIHEGGSMSSYGKFSAVSGKGFELSGFLYEQPTIDGRSAYQGRSEDTIGTPVEFFVLVDGSRSQLYIRDITVMGPTGWRRQNVVCTH